jgi:hypothetical protein
VTAPGRQSTIRGALVRPFGEAVETARRRAWEAGWEAALTTARWRSGSVAASAYRSA